MLEHIVAGPTAKHTLSVAVAVFVFEHYDSRDGTVAIVLPDISATSAALALAACAELLRVAPDQKDDHVLARKPVDRA